MVAVSVVGSDRPGIVAGITEVLYDLGCNLADATSTILSGHFSMVLLVTSAVPAGQIEQALAPVADRLELVTIARAVDEAQTDTPAPTHVVSVYGADRPGIVFRVARALALRSVNITDLSSRVIGDPETPVYTLMLEITASDAAAIQADLEALATELGVEAAVHPIETDVL